MKAKAEAEAHLTLLLGPSMYNVEVSEPIDSAVNKLATLFDHLPGNLASGSSDGYKSESLSPKPARKSRQQAPPLISILLHLNPPHRLREKNRQQLDPEDMCCFCDECLPQNLSACFMKTNQELRALPEVRSRKEAKNPLALYLPFSQRAKQVQLHKAELTTIPDGIKQGWPTHIEFNKLHSRIKRYQEYPKCIRLRQVPSLFFRSGFGSVPGFRAAQSPRFYKQLCHLSSGTTRVLRDAGIKTYHPSPQCYVQTPSSYGSPLSWCFVC
ncbi:hypothetical protein H4Q26_008053 [Puccinia striiformis f. sp. tritici PST-130]|nr:hypothetical protein H4Q26_008053 [Puccinia striiformis f. sp. tritici PST-130]